MKRVNPRRDEAPVPNVDNALRVAGVTKRYGSVVAVNDLSIAVESGEFLTVLGPSGCGKSTLLMLIAGFLRPSKGEIFIGGEAVSQLAPKDRQVGMVFQDYALFPHMSSRDNVGYGLKMLKWRKVDRRRRADELLELVGLEQQGDRLPAELSGGQQQRVAVAPALARDPAILLLDEPLSALDRALRMSMGEELRRIQQRLGISTVMVTHDREEAIRLSDRIALLRGGAFESSGTPQAMHSEPETPFTASFFAGQNLVPVEVVGDVDRNGNVAISLGEVMTKVRAAKRTSVQDHGFKRGDEGLLGIPKDAIELSRPGHLREDDKEIACKIAAATYLGESVEARAEIGETVVHLNQEVADTPLAVGPAILRVDWERTRLHGQD